ncbi:MAG: hypothetical protein UY07_C0017G0004 [Parcubacteria group bacterium GW2011_GWA1_47_8]|nr:hypothetical protein [uncultured bacterium]KKU81466.1 MAG: hypothetical protein UY07_C0017G0004 [Parcubacteria group bacterium GW2011_GWA1_47_8]
MRVLRINRMLLSDHDYHRARTKYFFALRTVIYYYYRTSALKHNTFYNKTVDNSHTYFCIVAVFLFFYLPNIFCTEKINRTCRTNMQQKNCE